MKKYLCISLFLCGCATYHPAVESVKSQTQYDADSKTCIEQGKQRSRDAAWSSEGMTKTLGIGLFGLLAAVPMAATDKSDYNKSPKEMADECMTAKGYKLVKD